MHQLAAHCTRRHALALLGGAALALPAAFAARGASAQRAWCRADPLLRIAGQEAHVYVASYAAMRTAATGKIRLVVTTPAQVEAKLLDVLADFGEGYDVEFERSRTLRAASGRVPVRVAVYAPASDGTLPILVDFVPVGSGPLAPASAAGTANTWITVATP
jgi:hypothetical protein